MNFGYLSRLHSILVTSNYYLTKDTGQGRQLQPNERTSSTYSRKKSCITHLRSKIGINSKASSINYDAETKMWIPGRPPQNHTLRLKRTNTCPPTSFLLPIECNWKTQAGMIACNYYFHYARYVVLWQTIALKKFLH